MAHIFQAPNQNLKEVELFIAEHVWRRKREFEERKATYPRRRAIAIVLLTVCVVAAILVIFNIGPMAAIRSGATNGLRSLSDWLYKRDGGGGLIGWVNELVYRIIALVVYLLMLISPVVVPILELALLAVIGFFAWCVLRDNDREFDVLAARAEAEEKMDPEMQRINAGVAGEATALSIVSALNDECYVFSNVVVVYNGYRNETDLIVVSPTGLTIVEVKNYSGLLVGDLSDRHWTQIKERHPDKIESNPVKQMGPSTYKLKHYLKDQGIKVNVRCCALFVNDNVQFQLTDREGISADNPMFLKNSPGFLTYLHSPGSRTLQPKEINRIVEAIKKFI